MPRAWYPVSVSVRFRNGMRLVRGALSSVYGARAEIVDALAIVVGWSSVTYGLAEFFGRPEIYPFAFGLFLLSVVGWGHLRYLFTVGMYTLSRDEEPPKRGRRVD